MSAEVAPDPREQLIDNTLGAWRQGDCVLGEHWFVHQLDRSFPVTDAGRAAAEQEIDLAEQQVLGLVVVTQTCDIVRASAERPFVEVCPLVEVDEEHLYQIQRARRPAYAFVPMLAGNRLVADLDRVMTIEKPLLATWDRIPGWSTDAEARNFALALSRKRARFAFPNDFNWLAKKLQTRLTDKHERNTDEGRGLRALQEIRVQASPSWDAALVEIFFWFVRKDGEADFEGKSWADLLNEWLMLVLPAGRFKTVSGQIVMLEDMTAQDYVDSDPLDLDHLSTGLD